MSQELLVGFKEEVPSSLWGGVVARLGCTLTQIIAPQNVGVVRLPEGADPEKFTHLFRARPEVQFVEPNGEVQVFGGG